jgi:hypothetical protein
MEISMRLTEALARFAYVQSHPAEISEADRQKAARKLTARCREEEPLNTMLRAERIRLRLAPFGLRPVAF